MKLDYDIELNILEDVHELDRNQCFIFSDGETSNNYLATMKIIDDILSDDYLNKWVDNTTSQFPPDLINEEDSLIMEVMRIDDHSPDGKKNPILAKQRKISKEIEAIRGMFPNAKRIFINAATDLPTDEDHNYKNYYTSFQRTIRKHLSKLNEYKKNHPNKKMIFLVADETSGIYIETSAKNDVTISGRPHMVFLDKRFINEFIDSDLEYLILYCPYNHFNAIESREAFPKLTIFDVKNMKNNKTISLYDYDEERMVSCERWLLIGEWYYAKNARYDKRNGGNYKKTKK